jgi:hypothetical protein
MKRLKMTLVVLVAGILAACSSVQRESVPLPLATPFDRNEFARSAYLEAFADGYRAAKSDSSYRPMYPRGPYPFARQLGWRAGVAAARSADAGTR